MLKPVPAFVLALITASAMSVAWWWNSPARFPPPQGLSSRTLNSLRALPPDTPSVPAFPKGKAVLVPGLEKLTNCFAPTLNSDLKQIVFAKFRGEATGFDLHLAYREKVTEPFGSPICIESTVSADIEGYPALSPDGLELLFVRSDAQPEIWYTQRADLQSEFISPQKWEACRMDGQASRVGTPQFVSAETVVFSRIDNTTHVRTLWSCQHLTKGNFDKPSLYAAPEGAPTVCFNPDGQRAYFGGNEGNLYLLWRNGLNAPFGKPDILLGAAVTGPFDTTIWIAPKEDLAFYCSPGPGKKYGSSRQLWMIGF